MDSANTLVGLTRRVTQTSTTLKRVTSNAVTFSSSQKLMANPVGTGGLITVDAKTARVVRMSVSRNHRRKRIGRALVTHLLDVARQRGFTRVIVATERGWDDAIGLYKYCGFTEYARDDVGVYFTLALACHSERSKESRLA
jgi:ribosomal protein S18 acetylase RimI-like enzyme